MLALIMAEDCQWLSPHWTFPQNLTVRTLVLKVLADWYREVPGINICLACLVFENLDGNRGLKARASGGHCHDKSISLTVNEIDLSWHVRSLRDTGLTMDNLIDFSSFYLKVWDNLRVYVLFITSCRKIFWQPHKETLISHLT